MVSLSAFTCFGKLPLCCIRKAIAGEGWPWTQGVPAPLCPGSSSSRGRGEETGVSIGRSCPNHVPGPGPIGWHPGGAGEVEILARFMSPALSCHTAEIADNLWKACVIMKVVVAEVSHLTVGAHVRQCISLYPTEWVSPALPFLRPALLSGHHPNCSWCWVLRLQRGRVSSPQRSSQMVTHRNRINLGQGDGSVPPVPVQALGLVPRRGQKPEARWRQMHWIASSSGSLQLNNVKVMCDSKCPHFGLKRQTLVLYVAKKCETGAITPSSVGRVVLFCSLFQWTMPMLPCLFGLFLSYPMYLALGKDTGIKSTKGPRCCNTHCWSP